MRLYVLIFFRTIPEVGFLLSTHYAVVLFNTCAEQDSIFWLAMHTPP